MGEIVRVTIVRHGETEHNKLGIVQGHLDIPLNESGIRQAKVVADFLTQANARSGNSGCTTPDSNESIGVGPRIFQSAFTSDLSRAHKTAQIIVDKQNLIRSSDRLELIADERIRERHLGDLQGTSPSPEQRAFFQSTMEPISKLSSRLLSFWDEMLESSTSHREIRDILYVSHGASTKCLVDALIRQRGYGVDFSLSSISDIPGLENRTFVASNLSHARIPNCSITTVLCYKVNESWRGVIVDYGADKHLMTASTNIDNVDVVE